MNTEGYQNGFVQWGREENSVEVLDPPVAIRIIHPLTLDGGEKPLPYCNSTSKDFTSTSTWQGESEFVKDPGNGGGGGGRARVKHVNVSKRVGFLFGGHVGKLGPQKQKGAN